MNINKCLIDDLLHENKMFFAKNEQLKQVKKEEINRLFQQINFISSIDLDDENNYMNSCRKLHLILANIIRITSQQNELLNNIKSNLNEITRLKNNGANEKTN